jgi:hypothetical protein
MRVRRWAPWLCQSRAAAELSGNVTLHHNLYWLLCPKWIKASLRNAFEVLGNADVLSNPPLAKGEFDGVSFGKGGNLRSFSKNCLAMSIIRIAQEWIDPLMKRIF